MIKNLRWYIAGLLMLATTINYLDRQTLSVAAPTVCKELGINDAQYGQIGFAFLFAYGILNPFVGRIIDRLGTRAGFAWSVALWSLANMAHYFAVGFRSLFGLRCLLGFGEAGNFPAAAKSISEWFPAKERTVATGIMNVGAGLGAVIAPPLVGLLVWKVGWQWAFVVTGAMGAIWLVLWLWLYHHPENHPRLTPQERQLIRGAAEGDIYCPKCGYNLRGLSALRCPECGTDSEHRREELVYAEPPSQGLWKDVLSRGELWALTAARFASDPAWFFYLFWLPKYLTTARGFDLKAVALSAWVPYLGADLGSIFGGFLSAWFIKRGLSTINARKLAMCLCAAVMPVAIPAVRAESPLVALLFITIATTAHQAWAASALTLPADLFPKRAVASAYGVSAMAGIMASGVFQIIVGSIVQNYGYTPVFMMVGFMHPVAALIIVLFVRSSTRSPLARANA